jgi:hypothetical protein
MATKQLAQPKAPVATAEPRAPRVDAPEPAAPKATTHPPISDYTVVWVWKSGVTLAKNQRGYVRVLKTDAATMIAAGDAQDPYGSTGPLKNISDLNRSTPPAPVVTVSITAFSAENPTVATASAGDVAKLKAGDKLKLTQTAGTTLPPLNGTGTVASLAATTFSLTGIDLSAFSAVVAGVTATGTVTP